MNKIVPLVQDPDRLSQLLKDIPSEPGVYLMKDQSDRILYIGKSKKLRSRVRSYFRDTEYHSPRISIMVQQVADIEFIITDTEAEALALEANLVKQHQPNYNVLLKDDKKYPYLCITWSEDYPRIYITRKRQLTKPKDRYYGPYCDGQNLRNTLQLVKKIFPLRQRPQPLFKDRPCLNYDIGKCPGVCQKLITAEDYHQTVQKVAMIFQGRTTEIIKNLTAQMEQAAESLNFEKAAEIRDQIISLQSLHSSQKVDLADETIYRDAIGMATNHQLACIQLFQIRAGKLVGRLGFVAENLGQAELGLILQRVLEEHYQNVDDVEIPPEILVQYPLGDEDFLQGWLTQKKGRKVTILTPQRQQKAELIEMVEKNAQYELERIAKMSDRHAISLQDLAEILDLPEIPHWIECYDISHIQGSDPVASRVVFIDGLPAKQHYRHYKIQNPEIKIGHSDDFASLAEVIGRRFRPNLPVSLPTRAGGETANFSDPSDVAGEGVRGRLKDQPDLIVIDGGKGQLSAVVEVLQKMELMGELKVISLAKQREEIFLPGESLPLNTDSEQPGVQLLRRLRDEAHRFAVTFHRQQRSKRMTRSHLDHIPGLGKHRQTELLKHFQSVDRLSMATPQEIAQVSGIGPILAQQIYDHFR